MAAPENSGRFLIGPGRSPAVEFDGVGTRGMVTRGVASPAVTAPVSCRRGPSALTALASVARVTMEPAVDAGASPASTGSPCILGVGSTVPQLMQRTPPRRRRIGRQAPSYWLRNRSTSHIALRAVRSGQARCTASTARHLCSVKSPSDLRAWCRSFVKNRSPLVKLGGCKPNEQEWTETRGKTLGLHDSIQASCGGGVSSS